VGDAAAVVARNRKIHNSESKRDRSGSIAINRGGRGTNWIELIGVFIVV
jgi:hypothetical protein